MTNPETLADTLSDAQRAFILAAAKIERDVLLHELTPEEQVNLIAAALSAARPIIEREAFEKAAGKADLVAVGLRRVPRKGAPFDNVTDGCIELAEAIAQAIRSIAQERDG